MLGRHLLQSGPAVKIKLVYIKMTSRCNLNQTPSYIESQETKIQQN